MQNDNNSAFPYVIEDSNFVEGVSSSGMTLRDYFAAKAMAEFIRMEKPAIYSMAHGVDFRFDWVSTCSYKMADAMIKAREA